MRRSRRSAGVMSMYDGGKLPKLLLKASKASVKIVAALTGTAATLQRMRRPMKVLHQHCDLEVFYHWVRPFLPGAKGMEGKGMPHGIVYHRLDGSTVCAKHVGGSAAKSSLFPFLDLAPRTQL